MSYALNINDLDEDCLKIIFSLFDLSEKLLLECVCLRWHRLICHLLDRQKVLKVGLRSSHRDCFTCMDIYYPVHKCKQCIHFASIRPIIRLMLRSSDQRER